MADALNPQNKRALEAAGRMFPTAEDFMQCIDDGTMMLREPGLDAAPDKFDAVRLKDCLALILSLTISIGAEGDDPGQIAKAIKQAVLAAYNLGRLRK